MISVALFDSTQQVLQSGGSELLEKWRMDGPHFIWVDIDGESEDAQRGVMDTFGVHPLAQLDALRVRHPPKLERFQDQLFLLLRGVDNDSDGIDFGVIQLAVFVGRNFLLTRHAKPSVSCAHAMQRLAAEPGLLAEGPGQLCAIICRRLAQRYVEILLELEQRLEDIEQEIFERPRDTHLAELTNYKARLREIQRIARYHTTVISGLRRQLDEVAGSNLEHELTDVYEQVERALSLATFYYDYAKDLTDGYLALSAHRLNGVMQVLTVITVIFVPLTFIAGIYGMNFENMPELSFRPGYFIVLSVMLTITISLIVGFRRRGWI